MEITFGPEAPEVDRTLVREVEVLSCNLDSVATFKLCHVEAIGAGFGVISVGVSPQQILSAVRLLRIRPSKWPDITEDVVFMGRAVADYRNEQAKQAREQS